MNFLLIPNFREGSILIVVINFAELLFQSLQINIHFAQWYIITL